MASSLKIPKKLPILAVQDNVLLPGSSMRIPINSAKNVNMLKSRLLGRNSLSSTVIGVVPFESDSIQSGALSGLHAIGTAAIVVQITGTNWPQPSYTVLVSGLCRFNVDEVLQETPYIVAKVTQLDKYHETDNEVTGDSDLVNLAESVREEASKLVEMLDVSIPVVAKLKKLLDSVPTDSLADVCASIVRASFPEKLQVLDAVDLAERLKKTLPLLLRQREGLKLLQEAKRRGSAIRKKSHHNPNNMRIAFQNIQDDQTLDDDHGEQDEIADLEHKIRACKMPKDAEKVARKELNRLKKMPQQMPEHALIRNYLELMIELPWSKCTQDTIDISKARKDLDNDHYGLEKLKKRVIEYLAVRQLKSSMKGPILCFVGPPGVGKTSVGRSIAHTLGREFHRIALGGVCDQSDIRGHRRTYIGAMPGRIINGLRVVGTKNPVFLLDEVDKLNTSLHGDPAAALLEVLDPEQNNTFVDHYLNISFDLSQVLFIATANTTTTIPAALLDRMEVIHVPGYTQEEKVEIANSHLVSKQLTEHGLTPQHLVIPPESIKIIVAHYTKEAGVRQLERKLGAVCRAVAVKVAQNRPGGKDTETKSTKDSDKTVAEELLPPELPFVIDHLAVEDILGPPIFDKEAAERLGQPGVAIGLAWTAMGGEIMFVEATRMPGEGKLTLTGQLGDVMKESATLALNWVRSHVKELGLGSSMNPMAHTDIHIHFPEGAVGKDGPSAGVTIVTVLVSLLTGHQVRSDTAMTGEVTLRGRVLPVGGIKEKVLAAHRAGLTRVVLPTRNKKDLIDVPNNVKEDINFVFVSTLEDVLNAVFEDGFPLLSTSTAANSLLSKL